MRLKRLFCPLLALALVITCFGVSVSAEEVSAAGSSMAITRATSRFTIDVPAGTLRQANTTFPLDPGEVVTIKASYSPFSANVDFGLIASGGRFYHFSATDGSARKTIEISLRGTYTFAIRNNSDSEITVNGFVSY